MSNLKFFTNGELNDPYWTGLTVAALEVDDDGNLTTGWVNSETGQLTAGYMAKEITKEQYFFYKEQLVNPDRVTYFPGQFAGYGIVSKTIYDAILRSANEVTIANLVVTRAQALIALSRKGITETTILTAIGDNPEAIIRFKNSLTFTRSSEVVKSVATALKLSDAEVDTLFLDASKI